MPGASLLGTFDLTLGTAVAFMSSRSIFNPYVIPDFKVSLHCPACIAAGQCLPPNPLLRRSQSPSEPPPGALSCLAQPRLAP